MAEAYNEYARYYDLLYGDKDYEQECDFIEEIFQKFAKSRVESILDGGCGSGGHAIPLARHGYQITGIDLSETMIALAKVKAKKVKQQIDFHIADLRHFDLARKFDACLVMFSALGYITNTEELLKTFSNIRRHLKKGSLFIFDVWNGLAVMRILPSTRMKTLSVKGLNIFRIAKPELDAANHLCRVHYSLFLTHQNGDIEKIEETHNVRFFFPLELTHYLSETGFRVLKICPFLHLNGTLDENIWNMTFVAQVV